MRGQSGIGTIIVFIAMILAAVVVAIVILQITDSLRGQAMLTERQARETMSARFNIERIEGIAYKTADGDYKLYYLILRIKPGVGTESLDLKKASLTYSAPGITIPGAKYEPISNVIQENLSFIAAAEELTEENITALQNINGACSGEMYNIMKAMGTYSYQTLIPYISPLKEHSDPAAGETITIDKNVIPIRDPSRFTVVWEECDNKDDIYTLSDGQTAYVIYPLPEPVSSSTYISIDLYVADGWSNPMTIRVPAGLDKGYVLIYPAS